MAFSNNIENTSAPKNPIYFKATSYYRPPCDTPLNWVLIPSAFSQSTSSTQRKMVDVSSKVKEFFSTRFSYNGAAQSVFIAWCHNRAEWHCAGSNRHNQRINKVEDGIPCAYVHALLKDKVIAQEIEESAADIFTVLFKLYLYEKEGNRIEDQDWKVEDRELSRPIDPQNNPNVRDVLNYAFYLAVKSSPGNMYEIANLWYTCLMHTPAVTLNNLLSQTTCTSNIVLDTTMTWAWRQVGLVPPKTHIYTAPLQPQSTSLNEYAFLQPVGRVGLSSSDGALSRVNALNRGLTTLSRSDGSRTTADPNWALTQFNPSFQAEPLKAIVEEIEVEAPSGYSSPPLSYSLQPELWMSRPTSPFVQTNIPPPQTGTSPAQAGVHPVYYWQ